jgi:hypothetical protein
METPLLAAPVEGSTSPAALDAAYRNFLYGRPASSSCICWIQPSRNKQKIYLRVWRKGKGTVERQEGLAIVDYEFADDALVDEDGDSEAEEADDGEAAAGPAEMEIWGRLQVILSRVAVYTIITKVMLSMAQLVFCTVYTIILVQF